MSKIPRRGPLDDSVKLGIPSVTTDPESLRKAAVALTRAIEELARQRGDVGRSAVRVNDLIKLGLISPDIVHILDPGGAKYLQRGPAGLTQDEAVASTPGEPGEPGGPTEPVEHGHSFNDLTDVPDCFNPCSHGHPWEDITGAPEVTGFDPGCCGVPVYRCPEGLGEEPFWECLPPENLELISAMDCCGIIVRECTEAAPAFRPVLGRVVMDKAWLAANHPDPIIPGSAFTWTVPAGVTSADVLVVGGGGPGRNAGGSGGGGGGEVIVTQNVALTPGASVAVQVGAARLYMTGSTFDTGNPSQFGTIVARGGYAPGNTSADELTTSYTGGESGSGMAGGAGFLGGFSMQTSGAGGGDSEAGEANTSIKLGDGGAGRYVGGIFGDDIGDGGWFGGGGAGGREPFATQAPGVGGQGGGGHSGQFIIDADNNTGGGAGGVVGGATDGLGNQNGRSGIVVIQWYGEEVPATTGAPIWKCIEFTATGGESSRIVITDGDGQAGNPTFDLREITQAVNGQLVAVDIDAWGRVVGNRAITPEDLPPVVEDPAGYQFFVADNLPSKQLVYDAGQLVAINLYDDAFTNLRYTKSLIRTDDVLTDIVLTRYPDLETWCKQLTYNVDQTLNTVATDVCAAPPPVQDLFWSHAFTGAGETQNFTERLGFYFTVGASDLVCNRLSYFGAAATVENIRVHRVSDGVLIAEANIAPTADVWVDSVVAEFTLLAGIEYSISHRAAGAVRGVRRNPTGLTFDAGITKGSNVFGATDALPTSTSANVYVAARFGYQV